MGRSQGGNNNSWCQDSPLSWMVWGDDHCDLELKQFLQRLLKLRAALPQLFNPVVPPREVRRKTVETPSGIWRQWHGVKLGQPDWAAWSRTAATSLHRSSDGALLWMGFNAYSDDLVFELPEPTSPWRRVIDTALPPGEALPAELPLSEGATMKLTSRSLVLLLADEMKADLSF